MVAIGTLELLWMAMVAASMAISKPQAIVAQAWESKHHQGIKFRFLESVTERSPWRRNGTARGELAIVLKPWRLDQYSWRGPLFVAFTIWRGSVCEITPETPCMAQVHASRRCLFSIFCTKRNTMHGASPSFFLAWCCLSTCLRQAGPDCFCKTYTRAEVLGMKCYVM